MALLADVKQNPDDLTPWLVLCDWLEDSHDEVDRARGEYCRLCFDKLGQKTYASDWERGERRRHLYRTYHEAWLGPILALQPRIKKGLLSIQSDTLFDYAEALEADPEAWAWVEALEIGHGIAELFSPEFGLGWIEAGLITLDILPYLKDYEVGVLASCPALRCVQILKFRLPELKPNLSRCLIESPKLIGIRMLEIQCGNPFYASTSERERGQAEEQLAKVFGDRWKITRSSVDIDEDE